MQGPWKDEQSGCQCLVLSAPFPTQPLALWVVVLEASTFISFSLE